MINKKSQSNKKNNLIFKENKNQKHSNYIDSSDEDSRIETEKKNNIIKELSEEGNINNSLSECNKKNLNLSDVDINFKIKRDNYKDSSLSSSISIEKTDKNNFIKSNSSQNLYSGLELEEKNDSKKIEIRTIKTLNMKDLKKNEKIKSSAATA